MPSRSLEGRTRRRGEIKKSLRCSGSRLLTNLCMNIRFCCLYKSSRVSVFRDFNSGRECALKEALIVALIAFFVK